MNLGITGTGIAGVITNSTVYVALIVYTWMQRSIEESVFWPDGRSYRGLYEYLKLGLMSTLMAVCESGVHGFMQFISGSFGVTSQATFIILFNLMVLLYQFSMGLDQASSAIIGRQIGENNVPKARLYFKTFQFIAFVIILVVMWFQYTFQEQIVSIYTNIPQVKASALNVMTLFVFHILPDLMKGMLNGIIKALGIQSKAVYASLMFHGIMYPILVYFVAFKTNRGIYGIMLAKIAVEYSFMIWYIFMINLVDW